MKYIILDTNVTASYYLPYSLDNLTARYRIKQIIDYCRLHQEEYFIYIPNICIAETFSVFYKYAFSSWNRHVKKNGKITRGEFENIVEKFQSDIHNGKFIYHLELNRYHILGINYIAPIDHYYQFRRKTKNGKQINPMGTFDHIVISMSMNLAHIHGSDNVILLTADTRMADMLTKCKRPITDKTKTRIGMDIAENVCGKPFTKDLFPRHLNLKSCKNTELINFFGKWPLV